MISLQDLQNFCKGYRNFDVTKVVAEKLQRINFFFTSQKLDSAVIGLSGGVDSALALALLSEASKQEGSSIKKIIALSLPIYCSGATDQENATRKAQVVYDFVKDNAKIEFYIIDLSDAFCCITVASTASMKNKAMGNKWSDGQLVSVLRTPVFYHQAALLQTQGYKSIVVGTTNRDEGAYVGFYGKASDGMVDLQVIGDLHKSEVWECARQLKIPPEIIDATPKGDVWDGRNDEEMIGVPYWFLEMYQVILSCGLGYLVEKLAPDDKKEYQEKVVIIENLRAVNKHKYLVGNPARFIDVMQRTVS